MLGQKLRQNGHTVHHAAADAELLIVKTALECAMTSDTVVIGDDTDLLVLLCYHSDAHSANTVYLKPQRKGNSNKEKGTWNIKQTKEKLGNDICDNILALHALLGCDTTSRLFGMGKGTVIRKFESNTTFVLAIRVFNDFPVNNRSLTLEKERFIQW